MHRILLFTVLAATCPIGMFLAANDSHDADYEYVDKIQIGDDNHFFISVHGGFSSEHGCHDRSYSRSRYSLSDPRADAQMRIAIASLLSRKSVHVWTKDCTGSVEAGRPANVLPPLDKETDASGPTTVQRAPSGPPVGGVGQAVDRYPIFVSIQLQTD